MEWTPIGGDVEAQETFIDINWETTKQFKGALDGQDNIIANINIKKETSGEIGLIGALGDTGVVKNIKISSGNIVGCRWVGAIAGISKGTIENCTNLANIKAIPLENDKTYNSGIFSGGIVGEVDAGTITNCINEGEVIAKIQSSGGIVGGMANGKIENCKNLGNVVVNKSLVNSSGVNAGGIIGYLVNGTIEKCYYYSDIITKGIGNQDNDVSGETEKVEDNIETYEEFLTWIEGKKE